MKKIKFGLLLALFLSLVFVSAALAQGETLNLSLSRDFGYGGFGGDIQGTFSLHASGPSTLTRVEFFIDETKIGEVDQAPFNLQFVTDNYPLGAHSLSAVGYTSDGRQLQSPKINRSFVSASAGTGAALRIVIPILILVFGALLLAAVVPLLMGRKTVNLPPGTPRQYILGGTVCPKCGRPFAFSIFGLRLVVARLERCPYCGRWSFVHGVSLGELRAAEQAEVETAQGQVPETSAEEKLKKELDDSKYRDA
ncbi:MAG: Ig-like domain-containing protein [Anaerolineales bacterium]